jgi:hypothetical protein
MVKRNTRGRLYQAFEDNKRCVASMKKLCRAGKSYIRSTPDGVTIAASVLYHIWLVRMPAAQVGMPLLFPWL